MSEDDKNKKGGGGFFSDIVRSGFEIALALVFVVAFLSYPRVMRWLGIQGEYLDPTTFAHTFLYKAAHLSAANLLVWIMLEFFYPTLSRYFRRGSDGPTFREDFESLSPLARTIILLGMIGFQLIYILVIL